MTKPPAKREVNCLMQSEDTRENELKLQRLLAKVKVDLITGCWLWTGTIDHRNGGYARFCFNYKQYRAHRFSYELFFGPIPNGLVLDHLCRVRSCVNPAHLEPVTSRENTLRGLASAAVNAAKTHCKHGHEFTPENTQMDKGSRHCRACHIESSRAFRQSEHYADYQRAYRAKRRAKRQAANG